jgi:hypothetical protein
MIWFRQKCLSFDTEHISKKNNNKIDTLYIVEIKIFALQGHHRESKKSQGPVAHTYYPSYLRGRDQEDQGSRSDQANSS